MPASRGNCDGSQLHPIAATPPVVKSAQIVVGTKLAPILRTVSERFPNRLKEQLDFLTCVGGEPFFSKLAPVTVPAKRRRRGFQAEIKCGSQQDAQNHR